MSRREKGWSQTPATSSGLSRSRRRHRAERASPKGRRHSQREGLAREWHPGDLEKREGSRHGKRRPDHPGLE